MIRVVFAAGERLELAGGPPETGVAFPLLWLRSLSTKLPGIDLEKARRGDTQTKRAFFQPSFPIILLCS